MDTLKKFLDSPEISKVVEEAEKKVKDIDTSEYTEQLSSDVLTETLNPLDSLKGYLADSITVVVGFLALLLATIVVLNHAILVDDPEVLHRTIPIGLLVTFMVVYYINMKLKK
jgi:hypothetical protein